MAEHFRSLSDKNLVRKFENACNTGGFAKSEAECVRIEKIRKILLERLPGRRGRIALAKITKESRNR